MTRSRSLKALVADVQHDNDDEHGVDLRSGDFNQLSTTVQPAAEQAIRALFSGLPLLDQPEIVTTIARIASDISDRWDRAQLEFVGIGKALLSLKRLLKDDFPRLRRGAKHVFPFGDATASVLLSIAEALEAKRLADEEVPRDWTTAGMIARMEADEIAIARERNLVRRDVGRREVIEFRRAMKMRSSALTVDTTAEPFDAPVLRSRADYEQELIDTQTEMKALQQRFYELHGRRRSLRGLLSPASED